MPGSAAIDSAGGISPGQNGWGRPAPGDLGIKERRSWHTWQLIVFGVGCLLLGMLITWSGDSGSSNTPKSSTGGNYRLPPAQGTSGTPTTAPGVGSATTQAPATSGATSPASTTVTTAPSAATPQTLLGPTPQSHGNWTSPAFTVGSGTWNIGWAFRCTPVPASGPSFQVFVVPSGGTAGSTPAINESGASGQSITAQTSTGSQELQVTAPASCVWLLKVTGVP